MEWWRGMDSSVQKIEKVRNLVNMVMKLGSVKYRDF